MVEALSTEAVTLERCWLPGPSRLSRGPEQGTWEGPASALCAGPCLRWRRAPLRVWALGDFVNRALDQHVTGNSPTLREVLSWDQRLPVLGAYLAQSVSFCTFFFLSETPPHTVILGS